MDSDPGTKIVLPTGRSSLPVGSIRLPPQTARYIADWIFFWYFEIVLYHGFFSSTLNGRRNTYSKVDGLQECSASSSSADRSSEHRGAFSSPLYPPPRHPSKAFLYCSITLSCSCITSACPSTLSYLDVKF